MCITLGGLGQLDGQLDRLMPDDSGETLLTKFAVDIAVGSMLIACQSNGKEEEGRMTRGERCRESGQRKKLTNYLPYDLWGCGWL